MDTNKEPKLINLVIALESVLLLAFLFLLTPVGKSMMVSGTVSEQGEERTFIKWVDFDVTKEAMQKAFRYDVDTCQQEIHLDWIELLAYLGTRYGGDFSRYKDSDMDAIAQRILGGEKMEEITVDMKYYNYYLEAYRAVLGGMVGTYRIEIPQSQAPAFVL